MASTQSAAQMNVTVTLDIVVSHGTGMERVETAKISCFGLQHCMVS